MPKVIKVEEPKGSLYHKVCGYCKGSGVDPVNHNTCRRCGDPLSNVSYIYLEGLIKNQLRVGAKIGYRPADEKFTVECMGKRFVAEHLIDAVEACWKWRHANEVRCVNLMEKQDG